MAQSLAQLYVHLIFGTKNRRNLITEKIEDDLHSYFAGILNNMQSPALEINSVPDHVHILFRLSKNFALAKVIEMVKKESSKWIKGKPGINRDFSWQGGYGAFSVSSSKVNVVRNYILNQKEHHRKVSFIEEISSFMEAYDVLEYSEEFFWS